MKIELNIRINRRIDSSLAISWIRQIVEKALSVSGFESPLELSVIITSDEVIRKLNKKYRGLNETTDVLSFALTENTVESVPFIVPPDGITHLGAVAISYPQAKKQAEQGDHSLEKEIALLLIHGVLHLVGYDHDKPQLEKKMRLLESMLLQEL